MYISKVWYQNSRARERKGQFRQNLQIINKKCPYCGAIFKIKSALESHLQSKHPDKQPINIDQIPDVKQPLDSIGFGTSSSGNVGMSQPQSSCMLGSSGGLSSGTNFQTNSTFNSLQSGISNEQKNDYKINLSGLSGNNHNSNVADTTATVASAPLLDTAGLLQNMNVLMKGGLPLDLSKTTPKYEPSESEVSYSDSNNDHEESNDFFGNSSANGTVVNNNNSTSQRIDGNMSLSHHHNSVHSSNGNNSNHQTNYNDWNYDSDMNMSGKGSVHDLSGMYSNDPDNVISPASPASSTHSMQKKRFRTQMTNLQVRILRSLFQDVKTPSMTDCENIGIEIGLPKRVVQVWFQNARAKEKKSRNNRFIEDSMDHIDHSNEMIPQPEDCKICKVQKVNTQEHVFSASHIAQVKMMLEKGESTRGFKSGSNGNIDIDEKSEHHNPSKATPPLQNNIEQDPMSVYNQFFMQNNIFNKGQDQGSGENDLLPKSDSLASQKEQSSAAVVATAAAMMNLNQFQQRLAAAQQSSSTSPTNVDVAAAAAAAAATQQLLLENNLLLQINSETNVQHSNSEILQQLYNYSQMSEKFERLANLKKMLNNNNINNEDSVEENQRNKTDSPTNQKSAFDNKDDIIKPIKLEKEDSNDGCSPSTYNYSSCSNNDKNNTKNHNTDNDDNNNQNGDESDICDTGHHDSENNADINDSNSNSSHDKNIITANISHFKNDTKSLKIKQPEKLREIQNEMENAINQILTISNKNIT